MSNVKSSVAPDRKSYRQIYRDLHSYIDLHRSTKLQSSREPFAHGHPWPPQVWEGRAWSGLSLTGENSSRSQASPVPRGGLKGLEFKCEKPAWVFSRCADAHRCTCESLLDVFQAAAPLAHMQSRALDRREKQRRSSCKWRATISSRWVAPGQLEEEVDLGKWWPDQSLRSRFLIFLSNYTHMVRLVRYKHLVFDIISVTVQLRIYRCTWTIHLAICFSSGWGLEEMWLKHGVVAERRKPRVDWDLIEDLCTFEQEAMYWEKKEVKEAKRIFVSCWFKSCCLWWGSLQRRINRL